MSLNMHFLIRFRSTRNKVPLVPRCYALLLLRCGQHILWLLIIAVSLWSLFAYGTARRCRNAALRKAVVDNNKPLVAQLLRNGANMETAFESGDTPLHLAARLGHVSLLPLLITPTTLDQLDALWHRWTPFQVALMKGHMEAASVLLDAMVADSSNPRTLAEAVCRHDLNGSTPLHHAASAGSQQLVAKLLEAGADRDAARDDQCTPLHLAAAGGHATLVPLLATPFNINLQHYNPHTPLC
jgi:ankyrin repeat protein